MQKFFDMLNHIAGQLNFKHFVVYKEADGVIFYHHRKDPRIELVDMGKMSEPHHRTKDAYFIFITPAVLLLGNYTDKEKLIGYVTQHDAIPRKRYKIAAGIIHATGPVPEHKRSLLLIGNTEAPRIRSRGEYPDDTIFPKELIYR
ncbi:MAG: hypothetical protein M3Q64_03605 [bacterium]|nr:hypothetical protein [bacterium]